MSHVMRDGRDMMMEETVKKCSGRVPLGIR